MKRLALIAMTVVLAAGCRVIKPSSSAAKDDGAQAAEEGTGERAEDGVRSTGVAPDGELPEGPAPNVEGAVADPSAPSQAPSDVMADATTESADPCNLSKMDAETKAGVQKQIECVSSVVDAIGPGWLKALKEAAEMALAVNAAVTEKIELTEEGPETPASGEPSVQKDEGTPEPAPEQLSSEGVEPEGEGVPAGVGSALRLAGPRKSLSLQDEGNGKVVMTTWELVNKIIDKSTDAKLIKPRWLARCIDNVGETSKSIKEVTEGILKLAESKSISAQGLGDLIINIGTATKASLQLGQTLVTCTPGNNKQAVAQLNRFVKKFGESLEALGNSFGAISAIATCGLNITQGAVTLAKNTSCLIGDLRALSAQTKAVREAAQEANRNSKEGWRRYGASCANPIRKGSLAAGIGLGVMQPLTDCSSCCSGDKFSKPGYENCSEKWKTCMLACGEEFGQNDPRFFYNSSAVVAYRGNKCADVVITQPEVEKVRCCRVCRQPEFYSNWQVWRDCPDAPTCGWEITAKDLGTDYFEGSGSARAACSYQYDVKYHRMQVTTGDCGFYPREQCR